MLCCKQCGGRDFEERANGKTTRAVLRAALALSEGTNLVLFTDSNSRDRTKWLHINKEFFRSVKQVVGHMGFLDRATDWDLYTVNGARMIVTSKDSASARSLNLSKFTEITET